jgi:NAD(P)-dependent dehydrogenase (short-subunit alcohol dehydrogenase family)
MEARDMEARDREAPGHGGPPARGGAAQGGAVHPGLEGQVVVVTGAASGIGLATAEVLVEHGATVLGVDADRSHLDRLEALGRAVRPVHADIADEGTAKELIALAETMGGPAVLVNNAAVMRNADLLELSSDDWDRVFAVNVRAMYLLCKAALVPMLRRRGGAIVNVSSVMALRAEPGSAAYSASKAAVLALTRDIAVSYAARGVRCNAICPGWVDTAMNAQFVADVGIEEATARVAHQQPLGRMLAPREVANVIAFLASDLASGITGVHLPVDGGMSSYYST